MHAVCGMASSVSRSSAGALARARCDGWVAVVAVGSARRCCLPVFVAGAIWGGPVCGTGFGVLPLLPPRVVDMCCMYCMWRGNATAFTCSARRAGSAMLFSSFFIFFFGCGLLRRIRRHLLATRTCCAHVLLLLLAPLWPDHRDGARVTLTGYSASPSLLPPSLLFPPPPPPTITITITPPPPTLLPLHPPPHSVMPAGCLSLLLIVCGIIHL
jgi:hypothetical protein